MTMHKPLGVLLLACAAALLPGCASTPSPGEMQRATATFQLPRLPEPGQAIVYVVRPYTLHTMTRFAVFVDSQDSNKVGETRGNQYIYFSLAPGTHRIYSKGENWAQIDIAVNAGDIVYLKQEPSLGVIGSRNALFQIDALEGKYYVMTEKLGTIMPVPIMYGTPHP